MVVVELILVLLLVGGGVAGLAFLRDRRREDRAIKHTPVVAIERASETYKVAQQATRLLEHLIDDEMVACTISETTKQRMKQSIDDFFNL